MGGESKLYSGLCSLDHLSALLRRLSPASIFLVTGKASFNAHFALIQKSLGSHSYVRFFDFTPNPRMEDAFKGMELFKKQHCDLILALGGGSVMDMAKLITLCRDLSPDSIKRVLDGGEKAKPRRETFIAVPTTPGSGSEATRFSVFYWEEKKYTLVDDSLMPDYVFLEPSLLYSLSPTLTAGSGLDALSQAVESWWSVNADRESEEWVKKAIPLIHQNLFPGMRGEPGALEALQKGAYYAGRAINISRTTAAHAFSYSLTSCYGVPHGFAVFLTLPTILKIHIRFTDSRCCHPLGAKWFRQRMVDLARIFGYTTPEELAEVLTAYDEAVPELVEYRRKYLSSRRDWDWLFQGINPEKLKTNPVVLSPKELYEVGRLS